MSTPSIDQFAKVLSKEPDWYSLGVFLGVSYHELHKIKQDYREATVTRCLIEVYQCLERLGKAPSWDSIARNLREMSNHALAEHIDSTYIHPFTKPPSESSSSNSEQSGAGIPDSVDQTSRALKVNVPPEVSKQYISLLLKITKLNLSIKDVLAASRSLKIEDVQHVIKHHWGLQPYEGNEATWENVFHRLDEECSMFDDPHVLRIIIYTFLSKNCEFLKQMEELEKAINTFKSSAKMGHLVDLLKKKKRSKRSNCKIIKLKIQEHWGRCRLKNFETAMRKLLGSLYGRLSCMLVTDGCYCISWIIAADIAHTSQLLPKHSEELFRIIGVISLQIGEEMVYDSTGEVPGCEVLEAAMLQAIELKNTRSIELLLAVGCSPEVATYNGDHAVTNVVNIRERSVDDGSRGGVDHMCVLGHNEHIEDIINSSREPEIKVVTPEPRETIPSVPQSQTTPNLYQRMETQNKELSELLVEGVHYSRPDFSTKMDHSSPEMSHSLHESTIMSPSLLVVSPSSPRKSSLSTRSEFSFEDRSKDDNKAQDSTAELMLKIKSAESASMISALTEQIKSKDVAFFALLKENEHLKEELKLKEPEKFVPPSPTVDQFVEVLSLEGSKWFDIGVLLGATTAELEDIQQNCGTNCQKCLSELHDCLVKKKKQPFTWDDIATALRRLSNSALTDSTSITVTESALLNSAQIEEIKSKEAAFATLTRELEELKLKETVMRLEITKLKEAHSLSVSPCTAVLPRQRLLGIGAEMKVKVITRDSDGKQLTNGGSAVRASLTYNKEECPVTDNGDGTYLVSVVPHQLGQHHLSITVNGGHIKDSPFTLNIVPQRDYTQLKEPSQTITGIHRPQHIAFSDDNGDMFVTSGDYCIHMYDKSGNRKATIGSKHRFQSPYGIDISNGVVYVVEQYGHMICMLTTEGECIGTFGTFGSGIGQFDHPNDVKISPDGRVYVADKQNHRVQVFNPDWTISHVIDSSSVPDSNRFFSPRAIAFDLSSDVHVTVYGFSSVTVFTPTGQFVRSYGGLELNLPGCIAIDPSGYSLVTSWYNDTLSVYDPSGGLVHSIGGLYSPWGVSVSPDGSVWVADKDNDRLVKYN